MPQLILLYEDLFPIIENIEYKNITTKLKLSTQSDVDAIYQQNLYKVCHVEKYMKNIRCLQMFNSHGYYKKDQYNHGIPHYLAFIIIINIAFIATLTESKDLEQKDKVYVNNVVESILLQCTDLSIQALSLLRCAWCLL